MANFCINCGNKLGNGDKFCSKCGTRADEYERLLNSHPDTIEKQKAKKELKRVTGGRFIYNIAFLDELSKNGLGISNAGLPIIKQVESEIDSGRLKIGGVEFRVHQLIAEYKVRAEMEKAELRKRLERLGEILDSNEVKSEIEKSNIDTARVNAIENVLYDRISKGEELGEEEIKRFIREELKKERLEQEKARTANENRIRVEKRTRPMRRGGNCDYNCAHCYEEFFDEDGGIVGDFTSEGYYEYYCHLGHPLNFGEYCEDYE